jgi:tetratricopeptide (TPR) repeat protein
VTRLALVMIARDEARCIGRALMSAAPFVDRMIVLDTGSLDETVEIADACGAEVYRFDWTDDFAAARNAALAYSDADWHLILDADEWIEGDPAEALATLGARAFLGEVAVMSRIEQGEEISVSTSWIPRLLPRGVHYAGRVHEQPDADLPRRRLDIRLGHDGYLPEQQERKEGRNEALLREALKAAPHDPYLWLQLGKEHQNRGRASEAASALARAYTLAPPDAPYRHQLVVRTISALTESGDLDEAQGLAHAEAENWPESPDFWFVVGALFLEWSSRNPDKALAEGLPVCEVAWKRCLEIGERDELDGAVRGRGGHMAAHNLAVMYEALNLPEQAREYAELRDRLKAG